MVPDPELLAISGVDRTVLQHDRVPMIHDLSHEDRTIIEKREVGRSHPSIRATWWLTLKGRRGRQRGRTRVAHRERCRGTGDPTSSRVGPQDTISLAG